MRITRIDTVRTDEFPNLVHVLVHTDEELTGLGETFFFADAVEAHVHDAVADYLLGEDPSQIERHAGALRGYVGSGSSGAEMRAASAIDIALWDLLGKTLGQPLHDLLGGRSRDQIRTYNTCAGERYVRGRRAQAVANWGLYEPNADGRHEDLDAFLHSPAELARSLLDEGTTGMKIWPFDPYAEATLGHDISTAELDLALEPFRRIRRGRRPRDGCDGRAARALGRARRVPDRLGPGGLRPVLDRGSGPGHERRGARHVQLATHTPIAAGETLAGLADYRDLLARDGARILIFDVGWVGGITAARKVAALAEAYERPVAPHDCTGPVVYTAATHMSLHLPNAIRQESVRAFWDGWYRDLVTALPVIERGMVSAPPGPGLGLELRPEVFERADVRIRSTSEEYAR